MFPFVAVRGQFAAVEGADNLIGVQNQQAIAAETVEPRLRLAQIVVDMNVRIRRMHEVFGFHDDAWVVEPVFP